MAMSEQQPKYEARKSILRRLSGKLHRDTTPLKEALRMEQPTPPIEKRVKTPEVTARLQKALEEVEAKDQGDIRIVEDRRGIDIENGVGFWGLETEGPSEEDQRQFQELGDAILSVREANSLGPLEKDPVLKGDPKYLGLRIKDILDGSLRIGIANKEEHPREAKTIDLGKSLTLVVTAEKLPGYNPNHRFYGASVISNIDADSRRGIYGSAEATSNTNQEPFAT